MEVTISLSTFNEMKEALEIREKNLYSYCKSHVSDKNLDKLSLVRCALEEANNVTLIMR